MGRKKKEVSPGDKVVDEERKAEDDKFKAFLDRVRALKITIYTTKNPHRYSWERVKAEPCDPYTQIEWTTGGVSGGSCWDTGEGPDPHRAWTSNDPEPEFSDLDRILEDICPSITFLQYKSIASKAVSYDTRSENEYYGNHTDYGIKRLDLKKLYEELKERRLLSE